MEFGFQIFGTLGSSVDEKGRQGVPLLRGPPVVQTILSVLDVSASVAAEHRVEDSARRRSDYREQWTLFGFGYCVVRYDAVPANPASHGGLRLWFVEWRTPDSGKGECDCGEMISTPVGG